MQFGRREGLSSALLPLGHGVVTGGLVPVLLYRKLYCIFLNKARGSQRTWAKIGPSKKRGGCIHREYIGHMRAAKRLHKMPFPKLSTLDLPNYIGTKPNHRWKIRWTSLPNAMLASDAAATYAFSPADPQRPSVGDWFFIPSDADKYVLAYYIAPGVTAQDQHVFGFLPADVGHARISINNEGIACRYLDQTIRIAKVGPYHVPQLYDVARHINNQNHAAFARMRVHRVENPRAETGWDLADPNYTNRTFETRSTGEVLILQRINRHT